MKELELTLKIRNNRLKQRREELGKTGTEIAKAIGMSYAKYVKYECMKLSPLSMPRRAFGTTVIQPKSIWKPTVLKLAAFHGVTPEELFPDAVLAVREAEYRKKVNAVDLLPLLPDTEADALFLPPPADAEYDKKEIERALNEGLANALTPLERKIIVWHFCLDGGDEMTLADIGRKLGISRERTRQLKLQALRKLKVTPVINEWKPQ